MVVAEMWETENDAIYILWALSSGFARTYPTANVLLIIITLLLLQLLD